MGLKTHFTFPADKTSLEELERLLVERAVDVTGEKPKRLRRQNSVSIDPRHFDYEIDRDDLGLVSDLPIHRCFGTYYDDTGMGGGARVYEQLGETFVELEHRLEQVMPSRYYHPDYLRVNYGVDPAFYLFEDSYGTIEREGGTSEWSSIRDWRDSAGVSERQLGRWFSLATTQGVQFDEPGDGRSQKAELTVEAVREALDVDAAYHIVSVILNRLADGLHPMVVQHGATEDEVDGVSEAVVAELDAEDEQARCRAVRHVAAVGTLSDEVYHSFLEAIQDTDDRTRLLVAPELWTPGPADAETAPDPELAETLLSLTSDSVPEIRIGALVGAGRILGRILSDTPDASISEPVLDELSQEFYKSHVLLLEDDDTRVREVTRRSVFRALYQKTGVMSSDELWERADLELRWDVVTKMVALDRDEEPATILYDEPDQILVYAFGSLSKHSDSEPLKRVDPSAISDKLMYELAWHAYCPDAPGRTGAKKVLTELARSRPEAIVDAVGETLADSTNTFDESFVKASVDHILTLISDQANEVNQDQVKPVLHTAARNDRRGTKAAISDQYDTLDNLLDQLDNESSDELRDQLNGSKN